MKTSQTIVDPPRGPSPTRRLALATMMLVVAGCATTLEPVDTVPTSRQFPEEAAEIREILDSMSDLAADDSEELVMAWDDLRSDLVSVSSDLERDAKSMELEGMVRRIEGFRDRFGSAEVVRSFDSEWEQLMRGLRDIHDRVGS